MESRYHGCVSEKENPGLFATTYQLPLTCQDMSLFAKQYLAGTNLKIAIKVMCAVFDRSLHKGGGGAHPDCHDSMSLSSSGAPANSLR